MIKLVDDIGAPVAVGAADILVSKYKADWSPWVGIGLAAVGYVAGGYMGIGGNFLKNVGIASMPWALKGIAEQVGIASMSPVTGRIPVSGRRITRYPAPAYEKEYQGVTLI